MTIQANLAMSMMTSCSIVTRTADELHSAQMSRLWLCLMLAGCNEAALPGGMVRGDLAMSGVGAACARDGDCASGVCFTAPPFSGGYCSHHIGECPAPGGTGDPCPAASLCINPGL